MKTLNFACCLLSAVALSVSAEKVRFEELPPEVQARIKAHVDPAGINDIDRSTQGGRTIYEVGFKRVSGASREAQQAELRFDERGQLLNADGSAALDSRKLSWDELPEVVKRTAATRMKQGEANDIDRQVKDGQATYEIGFRNNNQQQELLIGADGRILRDVRIPSELINGLGTEQSASSGAASGNLSPTPVTLRGTEKVQISTAPRVVQSVIAAAAGGARIEDVERGTWNGKGVYEAAFKSGGQHVELQVSEDGRIVHDPRSAAGRPAAAVSGRSSSKYADVNSAVPLSASQKVARRSIPAAVERAIAANAGTAAIEDIERGLWRSGPVYQVAFKDAAGQHVELQIDENGEVVYDPRGQ